MTGEVLAREQECGSVFHAQEITTDRSRTAEGRGSLEAETPASALGHDEARPSRNRKAEEAKRLCRGPMTVLGMSGPATHARSPPSYLA